MGQAIKVLIVEDQDILAENLRTYLQRSGWVVQVASNGQRALSTACAFRPEVLLLDYHLPDMNGFQILNAIRAHGCPCDCILMTGHCNDAVWATARQHGIHRFLCKPFSLAELSLHLTATAAGLPRHA